MNNRTKTDAKASAPADSSMNSQIQLLRSRVEAELKRPAVVMVTSALKGDGKSLTAFSLADSFTKSGHRAVLVGEQRRNGSNPGDYPTLEQLAQGEVKVVALPQQDDNAISREKLADFVAEMRADYDYTIVDVGTFTSSNAAMALTHLVDGILLTVRVGRTPTDEDEMMVRMIEHFDGRVIGVVATDEEAVAEFNKTRSGTVAIERPQARKVERKPARALFTTVACAAMLLLLGTSSQADSLAAPAASAAIESQFGGFAQRLHDAALHFGENDSAIISVQTLSASK